MKLSGANHSQTLNFAYVRRIKFIKNTEQNNTKCLKKSTHYNCMRDHLIPVIKALKRLILKHSVHEIRKNYVQ